MAEHYLLEAALENLEAVIDPVINNDIVKSIPVIGTAFKVIKGASDIRDRMFAAKLTTFLLTTEKVTPQAKEEMRQRIASSPDEAKKVGQALMLVLDKITALEKAEMMAYIFIAHTLGQIGAADFRRLLDAIDQAFVDDLADLLGIAESKHSTAAVYMKHLSRTGLTFADSTKIAKSREDWHYDVSRLGKQLIDAYRMGLKYCTDH
jgi:hypothetical protein